MKNYRVSQLAIPCAVPFDVLRRWTTAPEWRNVGRAFATRANADAYIATQPDQPGEDPRPVLGEPDRAVAARAAQLRRELASGQTTRPELAALANSISLDLSTIGPLGGADGQSVRYAWWLEAIGRVLAE